MRLFHCFRDAPANASDVWLPQMTVQMAAPEDRERLQAYLDEQAEYGMTPDVYYAAERPLFGYGPFVEVIEISDEYVFRGATPGEFIMPSDMIDSSQIFFNPHTDHETENCGYPEWKELSNVDLQRP